MPGQIDQILGMLGGGGERAGVGGLRSSQRSESGSGGGGFQGWLSQFGYAPGSIDPAVMKELYELWVRTHPQEAIMNARPGGPFGSSASRSR